MASTYGTLIDGEWTDAAGGETSDVYNPADRGDHAGSYQRATEGEAGIYFFTISKAVYENY